MNYMCVNYVSIALAVYIKYRYMYSNRPTCTLNFHMLPTGTPGMGPKWLEGTMVHCLVRPTHAMPYSGTHCARQLLR